MDCLRSFNLFLAFQSNMNAANGLETWTIGTQNFWLFNSTAPDSTFDIRGFKNINIFKIDIGGDINSDILPAGFQCLVQNYSVQMQIIGQNAIVGGSVVAVPNGFNMITQPTNPIFKLSKYLPSITFESPLQSATQLIVQGIFVDGIANESLVGAQLNFFLTLTVYYNFEGE